MHETPANMGSRVEQCMQPAALSLYIQNAVNILHFLEVPLCNEPLTLF